MILDSSAATPAQAWVWTVVLLAGFLTLICVARAGSILFWSVLPEKFAQTSSGTSRRLMSATLGLLAMSLVLAVAASPFKRYTDAAAAQLADQSAYRKAVLGAGAGDGGPLATTRPYRGGKGEVKLPGDKP